MKKQGRVVILVALAWVLALVSPANAVTTSTWVQTTQADFEAGLRVNVDTVSSPGDVMLGSAVDFNRPSIAGGYGNTLAIKEDGTVLAVGDGMGQYDLGWSGIKAIAAGVGFTVGLKDDGTVVGAGGNSHGQLNVSGWTGIKAIAAGEYYTVGLKEDGTVLAVGQNHEGQLNVSSWTDIVAIAANYDHTVGLKADGTVVAVGAIYLGQCDVSGWSGIKSIAAGEYTTFGLKEDGTVVAVGYDNWGQVSGVSGWTGIKAIATGFFHTLGLKEDGTVVAVGYDNWGQVSGVSGWSGITAIAAGGYHSVGLKADGTVVAVGMNDGGQLGVSGWTGVRQTPLAPGSLTSSVLDAGGMMVPETLWWTSSIPAGSSGTVKFQLATNQDNATWSFVGPDGTANTYYTAPGQAVWQGHAGDRYMRYEAYLSTGNRTSPILSDVTIAYRSGYTPPTVLATDPSDGAIDVPLNQIITVSFSEDIQVIPPESNISLYDEKRFVLVGRTLSVNGNILTITPVGGLIKNTTYSVTIPNFSIEGLAGNEMAADKIFYFTTVKH